MKAIITILIFLSSLTVRAQEQLWYILQQTSVIDPCAGVATAADADAQKFLCALKISSANQYIGDAVNTLVRSLKDSSLWAKLYAYYPMASDAGMKTRADQMAYNLKDTNLYRLTWGTGFTYSATGVDFAAESFASTNINPAMHLSSSSVSLGFYSRETQTGGSDWMSIQGSSAQLRARIDNGSGNAAAHMYTGGSTVTGANGGTQGMFIFVRTAASGTGVVKIYKNGTQIATGNLSVTTVPNSGLTLGTQVANGGSGQRECAGAFVADGLTADEARALSTITNAFNTALSRNVY